MKRHIAGYGFAAIGICVGMTIGAAQSVPDAGGPVTVTGCLLEFTPASSASDSESSLTTVSEQFVLANARPASASSGGAGTGAGAAAAITPTRYVIIDLQTDEMRKHVLHQVEVVGTVAPRSSTPAGRGLDDLRRLHASSIRTIAGACTPRRSSE